MYKLRGMVLGTKINKIKKSFLGLLAVAGFICLAAANAPAEEPSPSVPTSSVPTSLRSPALKQYEDAGGTVDFIGSAHGLDGWVVRDSKGDVKMTVYTTQDGAMVSGLMFSAEGANESAKQLEAYHQRITGSQAAVSGAEKSSSKSEKLYAEVEKAGWVGLGNSTAPYLYIFMNVNCDHCQDFWKDLESTVNEGKLQVRLVPYGEILPENRDGGAALLSIDEPLQAWAAYVSGDKSALSKDKAKDEGFKKLDANTAMVKRWKLGGPPFTLYRRPADGILTAIAGRPDNVMLLLAEFIK